MCNWYIFIFGFVCYISVFLVWRINIRTCIICKWYIIRFGYKARSIFINLKLFYLIRWVEVFHSDFSEGRTEQVVYKQPHQLPHQAHTIKVPRSIHPTARLRDIDSPCGHRQQDTGFWTKVSTKTAPHLLHKVQYQRVRQEHDSSACRSSKTIIRKKLAWFGHVTRHGSLCNTVL